MLGRSFRLVLHYSAETKAEPRAARSEGAGDPGMRRIVEKHGADSNAADPVRVLRVPGFYHCKGKRALVRLTKCGGRRYTTAETGEGVSADQACEAQSVAGRHFRHG